MTKNNSDNNKENKKPLFRKILVAFFFIDLIVGVIFLVCYFKGCSPFNRNTSSSSSIASSIDNTDYQQLDNKFKQLVKTQMEYDGFDGEEITRVAAVTYQENPHVSFDLTISAVSDSNLYVFSLKEVKYKEGTYTLVSYLLCNNDLEGGTNLYKEKYIGDSVIVPNGRYVISTPITNNELQHKTGYELKEDGYHVTQLVESKENESRSTGMIIKEGQPLYNYYSYLNK